jgi:hypothetical protein
MRYITVSYDIIDEETIGLWKSMGIRITVHTANDKEEADGF